MTNINLGDETVSVLSSLPEILGEFSAGSVCFTLSDVPVTISDVHGNNIFKGSVEKFVKSDLYDMAGLG